MPYSRFCRWLVRFSLFLCCCGLPAIAPVLAAADSPGSEELVFGVHTAPVVIDGNTLFMVRGISSFPAEKRAEAIAERIRAVAADPAFSPEALQVEEGDGFSIIKAGDQMLVRVGSADAEMEEIDRFSLSRIMQGRIGEAIVSWRSDREPQRLQRNGLISFGATVALVLALAAGRWIYRRLRQRIEARLQGKVQDVQLLKFQILRGEQLWRLLMGLLSLLWMAGFLLAIYLYLYGVLTLFPWTRGFANSLLEILVGPLKTLGQGLLGAVPNLVFLLVLYLLLRYLLRLVRLFFTRVADGTVTLHEFDPDWAWPTYRLLRLLLVAFTLIVAYPYIPGSESGAFKGVSIFIGVLFSLGSSSLIGNLIAGYTMTYRRAFRVGDRIKVGEYMGDVMVIRLLVTHLRTPKNEEVVIPNSTILGGEVVNYSALARQQGLILHTTVGIGYETPWRQVEAMLLEAAARTPGLLREPLPFVLQKGLGDFAVTYEINVYCAEPQAMGQLYSELHRNILDVFNEYGVQIMTPSYEGDPEQPKVVPKEQWFAAPASAPEGQG